MSKRKVVFFIVYIVVLGCSMFIEPREDDWLFLNYFDNHANWGAGYTWLNDNMLLARNFWRPIEDMLLLSETYVPAVYPYFNHFLIVTCYFLIAWLTYSLMLRIRIRDGVAFVFSLLFLVLATNMGSLLSVDSITMVLSVLFGMLYVRVYISRSAYRKLLLVVWGVLCCLSKENGFVFLILAPVYRWLIYLVDNNIRTMKELPWNKIVRELLLCSIPVVVYLGLWYYQHELYLMERESMGIVKKAVDSNMSLDDLFKTSQSYELTPVIFIKNIAILYVLGIYPLDTSAIYYGNWIVLSVNAVLSIAGLYLLFKALRGIKGHGLTVFVLVCMIVIASAPSLITRAGEISGLPSNVFIIVLFAFIYNRIQVDEKIKTALLLFIVATFITDVHKYSLAYEGGRIVKEMSETIKRQSVESPENVLWIGTTVGKERAGAAFGKDPYKGIASGKAFIRAYGYKYPKYLKGVRLPYEGFEEKVDSILTAEKDKYDCIWITKDDEVRVVNN